jgi:hypothetical protein
MSERPNTDRQESNTAQKQAAAYQIQIQGELGPRWLHWFDDLAVTVGANDDGTIITSLTSPALDQAGLRGILNKLWDLNLTLLSVNRTGPAHHDSSYGHSPADESAGDKPRRKI